MLPKNLINGLKLDGRTAGVLIFLTNLFRFWKKVGLEKALFHLTTFI